MRRFLLRLWTFVRAGRAEVDLRREIESHLQLLQDAFVADGMSPDEARFAARRAFGGQVEQVKERQRDARSFRVLDQWWLDVKLALRMLVRYPGLTVVGTIGMAVAMALASGAFAIIGAMLSPSIPLDEGERVVSIQFWNVTTNMPERRIVHDFAASRGELTAIDDLGAFRQVGRNLILRGAAPEVVRVAEMTASGFRIARVAPLLGRYLADDDERPGAPPVAVIGHREWRRRFAADPAIIGKSIQLGTITYTVVGVMPEGFAFPVNDHFWVPLQIDPAAYARLRGPELMVFGRLGPGRTREAVQAELTTIGQRLSGDFPATHAQLRPYVVPYTYPFSDMDEPENALALRLMQFLVALLLGVVAINVAILVYARTATRHAEIAVRSALGASRRRIVTQLFIEALALSLLAAVVGLGIVAVALGEIGNVLIPIVGELPFWLDFRLHPAVVIYSLVLAVFAAAIVGIVPSLKATGRHVQRRLQGISTGGSAGMRLGATWTALVVAQVAVAVALLPMAVYHAWDATQHGIAEPGFPAQEFLRARLVMDRASLPGAGEEASEAAFSSRYADRLTELMRRLEGEADVRSVTFARAAPGEEGAVWIAVDGVPMPPSAADYSVAAGTSLGHQVGLNRIAPNWLEVFDVAVLAGRRLTGGDARGNAVLVNERFVRRILNGGNALGQQLRYVGVSGDASPADVDMARWHEIVGIVPDFPVDPAGREVARVYQAVLPDALHPAMLAVRVRGEEATAFAARLREITAAVDPDLQLRGVDRIDAPAQHDRSVFRLVALGLVVLTLSVVVLSAAGIYALMACTVEQRRREIGIRTALGADPRRILAAIFARALAQLGVGAALGMGVALLLEIGSGGEAMAGYGEVIIPIVAAFMMTVGLIAALGPARRGLRVHPTETLRAE
jgi:putative ABC transport system permease protein